MSPADHPKDMANDLYNLNNIRVMVLDIIESSGDGYP
jgi:hypothetical protein